MGETELKWGHRLVKGEFIFTHIQWKFAQNAQVNYQVSPLHNIMSHQPIKKALGGVLE